MRFNQFSGMMALVATWAVCGLGFGKPISMQPDREMAGALWVAEVTVLSITQGKRIRVRVTSDPSLVFRGFEMLGRTLEVHPSPYGPGGCLLEMNGLVDQRKSVLMVVRPSRQIALIGRSRVQGGQRIYRLRTWCDYNGWWMFSQKKDFGRRVERNTDEPMSGFEVSYEQTASIFQTERATFYQRCLRYLEAPPRGVERKQILNHIERLGADMFPTREHAQRQLVKSGIQSVPILEQAFLESKDIEKRYRIRQVISGMNRDLVTYEFVQSLRRESGVEAEARLLLASYETLTGAANRRRCVRRLRDLSSSVKPPLSITAGTTEAELLASWRQFLNRPEPGEK